MARRLSLQFLVGREHLLLVVMGFAAASALLLFEAVGSRNARERAVLESGQQIRAQGSIRARALENRAMRLVEDALFLASVPPIQGIVRARLNDGFDPLERSTDEQWKRRLAGIFSAFARTSPELMQIRLIGVADQGREIVRVNRIGDRVEVVPESLLQRKGDRPYFQSSRSLAPGQVWLSPLDLNVENGKVQIPKMPTLRGTTPVHGPNGKLFGILVVNLDASIMLAELRQSIPRPVRIYLVNNRGDFLSHPVASREFGMDLGTPWRWADEFEELPSKDTLRFVTMKSAPGRLLVNRESIQYNIGDPLARWTMVTAISDSALEERVGRERKHMFSITFGIVMSGTAILYLFVLSMLRRIQVRESQARLGAIVDGSPDAIVGISFDGRITSWNHSASEHFGRTEAQSVGRLFVEHLTYADAQARSEMEMAITAAALGTPTVLTVRFSSSDGSAGEKIVLVSVHPVRGDDREVASLAATLRDITDRETSRRRIEELNTNLEAQVRERTRHIEQLSMLQGAILQYAGWAIMATDRQGMITVFNPAAESMLGRTAEETIGCSPLEFHDPKELSDLVAEIRRREGWDLEGMQCLLAGLEKEGSQLGEWTWIRKDGTRFPVLLSISVLKDDAGTPMGFITIAQDLTERKRIEDALRQRTEEAEVASRAKAEFLANMSHEIRTPLNGVLGIAAALARRDLDPVSLDLVGKIRQSGALLRTILDDILDMSKIQAGRLELEAEPFPLDGLLDNLANLVSVEAGRKGLELVVGPVPPSLTRLVGDTHRLQQILMNLVGNAIKFTQKGSIVVEIEDLGDVEGEATVGFAIRDTGVGIESDKLPSLFQPFTQADASTTRRFGGTGLGLAISKLLVEKMDGKIEVESEPGKGTLVRFTVRLRRSKTDPSVSDGRRHLDVLVVDDSELARDALARIANSIGWEVEERDNGLSALAAVMDRQDRGTGFDVLLLDWKMPDVDGLATARMLREQLRSDRPPVVLLATSYSLEELENTPGKEHVDGIVVKPVTGSRLFDAVARVLKSKGMAGPTSLKRPGTVRLEGLRILIVDDSEINRDVGSLVCTDEGARVVLASDGTEALAILESDPAFDVVLMDVQMPVMDGCEATRRIRRIPGLASLPVIALTAGVLPEERETARQAGVDAFVGKPFLEDELVSAILEVVRHQSASAPASPSVVEPDQKNMQVFDISLGLRTWRESDELKLRLNKFEVQYGASATEISQALDRGDVANALFVIHRLHSAAGFLGLTRLSEVARRLEKALRDDAAWREVLDEFKHEMAEALQAIAAWDPPSAG